MSRPIYNVASISNISEHFIKVFGKAYVYAHRFALHPINSNKIHCSNNSLYEDHKIEPSLAYLRKLRLNDFARFLRTAPAALKHTVAQEHLLQSDQSWL